MRIGIKFEMYKISGFEPLEIRFDKDNSVFFAEFIDTRYKDKDLNGLKKQLEDEAKAQENTTFKPVILIDDSWMDGNKIYSVDKKMLCTTTYPDGHENKYLAYITEDWNDKDNVDLWKTCYPHRKFSELNEKQVIINYTKEKYDTLKLILIKIDDLKDKLQKIIFSDDCEKFLQHVKNYKTGFLQLEYDEKDVVAINKIKSEK